MDLQSEKAEDKLQTKKNIVIFEEENETSDYCQHLVPKASKQENQFLGSQLKKYWVVCSTPHDLSTHTLGPPTLSPRAFRAFPILEPKKLGDWRIPSRSGALSDGF